MMEFEDNSKQKVSLEESKKTLEEIANSENIDLNKVKGWNKKIGTILDSDHNENIKKESLRVMNVYSRTLSKKVRAQLKNLEKEDTDLYSLFEIYELVPEMLRGYKILDSKRDELGITEMTEKLTGERAIKKAQNFEIKVKEISGLDMLKYNKIEERIKETNAEIDNKLETFTIDDVGELKKYFEIFEQSKASLNSLIIPPNRIEHLTNIIDPKENQLIAYEKKLNNARTWKARRKKGKEIRTEIKNLKKLVKKVDTFSEIIDAGDYEVGMKIEELEELESEVSFDSSKYSIIPKFRKKTELASKLKDECVEKINSRKEEIFKRLNNQVDSERKRIYEEFNIEPGKNIEMLTISASQVRDYIDNMRNTDIGNHPEIRDKIRNTHKEYLVHIEDLKQVNKNKTKLQTLKEEVDNYEFKLETKLNYDKISLTRRKIKKALQYEVDIGKKVKNISDKLRNNKHANYFRVSIENIQDSYGSMIRKNKEGFEEYSDHLEEELGKLESKKDTHKINMYLDSIESILEEIKDRVPICDHMNKVERIRDKWRIRPNKAPTRIIGGYYNIEQEVKKIDTAHTDLNNLKSIITDTSLPYKIRFKKVLGLAEIIDKNMLTPEHKKQIKNLSIVVNNFGYSKTCTSSNKEDPELSQYVFRTYEMMNELSRAG